MRILITGHSGAVGSRLAKRLEMEHEVVGIDTKDGENLMTCKLPENIDLIYHLAAHASVEESWKDPVRNMENITTTVRLAHAYPDVPIIYASSCAVYDPASPYGFSKKGGHDYLQLFHPNSIICVFPNIYGTGRSVVDFFKGKDRVTIFGDGMHRRDYVHVDDIVEGLVKAKKWDSGVYHMGGGQIHTAVDFAEGKEVNFQPERKEAIESIIPNTTPNWEPTINVMDYLND